MIVWLQSRRRDRGDRSQAVWHCMSDCEPCHWCGQAKKAGRTFKPRMERPAAPGEIRHGTASGYNAGCREECCKAAYRIERKKWREKPRRNRKRYPDKRVGERKRSLKRKVKSEVQAPVKAELQAEVKSPPRLTAAQRRAAYYADHSQRLSALLEER